MNDMTNDFGRNPTVENIPLAELTPFRNHPFKVKDDAEMVQLTKSIADFGVLVPALARPTENGYELISGHRRMAACKELGLETMPVIIRDMTDKEAIIAMVDSNLQREHILPSEKAFAYKMKYDAMKHQGTSRQLGTKSRTDEIIAEKSDDSARQIQRYIRLTNLIPDLLTMMDEGRIAFSVGVELSYLDNGLQYDLLDIIQRDDHTPSYSQAWHMHEQVKTGTLSRNILESIMAQEKANQRETLKIPADRLRSVLPSDCDAKKAEDFIVKACEHYKKYLQRQRDAR
jgi:ParB family chromosome partitioning protein